MWLDLLGDLLAPARCASCDERVGRRCAFCAACAASIEPAVFASPLPHPCAAIGAFGGALAHAIHRLKYDDRPDLAWPLGELMASAWPQDSLGASLVVPVPLADARLRERGYNQAALLAARVARRHRLPHAPEALARVVDTGALAHEDHGERRRRVQGAFTARGPVAAARVVLVDDVLTSGATLGACAEALQAAGARVVGVCTAARVERYLARRPDAAGGAPRESSLC